MTARTCSDGSSCVVTDDGPRLSVIARYVEGEMVWGQAFSAGLASDHALNVGRVVANMVANPEGFDRRSLWDANGKAVGA